GIVRKNTPNLQLPCYRRTEMFLPLSRGGQEGIWSRLQTEVPAFAGMTVWSVEPKRNLGVIPAEAGTTVLLPAELRTEVPAFAGMTWWVGYPSRAAPSLPTVSPPRKRGPPFGFVPADMVREGQGD